MHTRWTKAIIFPPMETAQTKRAEKDDLVSAADFLQWPFFSWNYSAIGLLAWGLFPVGWLGIKSDWHNPPLP